MIGQTLVYMGAAVVLVPLFRLLGLGAVLGYLAAGIVIGPWGLKIIWNVESILHFSELGVVFLLFLIGLELKPSRLWALRKPVFGLGGAQVILSAIIIGAFAMAFGLSFKSALITGLALALSSTAFALQILAEKNQLGTLHGRSSFAILLFQDLSVIPLLAIIPLLGTGMAPGDNFWMASLEAAGMIAAIVGGGRFLIRPIFRLIAQSKTKEVFTAASLLLVLGVASLMEKVGLSMALGAFLAGVLLADSEYRHELEANLDPFKGLLLGLFFIAVGMSVDFGLLTAEPFLVLALTAGLILVKLGVLFFLGKANQLPTESARNLAFTLSQGGEFAFVLFGVAARNGVLDATVSDRLILVVTLSMVATPFLFNFNQKYLRKYSELSEKPFDEIPDHEHPVIIAGFGRVGQIISRILRLHGFDYTALEHNPSQVETARKFGTQIFYGDASRLDLLLAAGAEKAKIFVLAIDEIDASVETATIVRKNFPNLKIVARARNREHAFKLMDLGVKVIHRETYGSSLEAAQEMLESLGVSTLQAKETIHKFRKHDQKVLNEQYELRHDEKELQNFSKQAAAQLEEILRADREAGAN